MVILYAFLIMPYFCGGVCSKKYEKYERLGKIVAETDVKLNCGLVLVENELQEAIL